MKYAITALALGLSLLAPSARASETSDRLSRCLVDSATQDDRRALVRWVFSAMAAHPDLEGLAAIDDGRRKELDETAAAVFERLIAKDCTAQARESIVRDGSEGFSSAFETLGELAMGGVVDNKQVQAGMERLGGYIDEQRVLKALLTK